MRGASQYRSWARSAPSPRSLILDLLSTLHERFGQTFVMVTHDPRAAAAAGRVVRLDKGRILSDERREEPAP